MSPNKQLSPWLITGFSVALVSLSFFTQGRIGFTYSDEGFLWYGAVHTLAGEIPILDFQSYDPGRYYWSAFWMMFFGESMLALRFAVAIFQLLGLIFGMLVLRRVVHSWQMLGAIGLLMILWMSPHYQRLFEISTSLIALSVACFLIDRPSLGRHFIAGAFTGLAAFFGRNLGVYCFVSFFFLISFIWARLDRSHLFEKFGTWSLGIIAGYSPMLLLLLFVPGFYDHTLVSIFEMLERGSTNIFLPPQWPWLVDYTRLSLQAGAHAFSFGALLLLMPLYYVVASALVVCSSRDALRSRTVLLAGLAVGVLYVHYAFSRADLEHLMVSMPVLLVTMVAFPQDLGGIWVQRGHRALMIAFAALTLFSAGVDSPLYRSASARAGTLVEYDVGGSDLWVTASDAKLPETVERIHAEIVPDTEGLLILPFWPALYVLLERDSPLREIYFLFAPSMERQREIIRQLEEKRVNWVLIGNLSLHESSASRFRSTHPLLWEHLRTDFASVEVAGLQRNFALLKRR